MTEKEELEIKKLHAEIKDLEQREARDSEDRRRQIFQFRMGTGIAVVTILGGTVAAYTSCSNFFDQQARRYELDLEGEMVKLIAEIAPDSAQKGEAAMLLLSAYEQDAIPFLLWRLRESPRREDGAVVIEALRRVEQKERVKPRHILDPLLESSRQVLETQLRNNPPDAVPILNHLAALGAFAGSGRRKIRTFLDEAEVQIASEQRRRSIPNHVLVEVADAIEDARNATGHQSH